MAGRLVHLNLFCTGLANQPQLTRLLTGTPGLQSACLYRRGVPAGACETPPLAKVAERLQWVTVIVRQRSSTGAAHRPHPRPVRCARAAH